MAEHFVMASGQMSATDSAVIAEGVGLSHDDCRTELVEVCTEGHRQPGGHRRTVLVPKAGEKFVQLMTDPTEAPIGREIGESLPQRALR